MDPISQGVTGSTVALLASRKSLPKNLFLIAILGFLSGMAADLDVIIRSETDPLLFLEYHRQFTHSFLFIPIGGLLCALVAHPFTKKRLPFWRTFLYCTLGYSTHGLLDTCTSYGTLLLWPFSDYRFAFNYISIIDPLYTLPLIILCTLYCKKANFTWTRVSALWMLLYLALGALQYSRALEYSHKLAHERGHEAIVVDAKPSFANLVLWKTIYTTSSRFYVDAVHLLPSPLLYTGSSVTRLQVSEDFPQLKPEDQAYKDIERFNWFSMNYTAHHPLRKNYVIDIRYSLVPNEIEPLWGITIPSDATQHVTYTTSRKLSPERQKKFFNMLLRKKGVSSN